MSNTYTDSNTLEDLFNEGIELGIKAGYSGASLELFATHYAYTVHASMPDATTRGD